MRSINTSMALEIAAAFENSMDNVWSGSDVGYELRRQHAEIQRLLSVEADLRAQLSESSSTLAQQPAAQGEPVPQWRKPSSFDWHDGYPDNEDGGGPYQTRVLYTHPQKASEVSSGTTSKPMTDGLESALEALVNRCNNDAGLTNDDAVIAAEAALERLYKSRIKE